MRKYQYKTILGIFFGDNKFFEYVEILNQIISVRNSFKFAVELSGNGFKRIMQIESHSKISHSR